MLYGMTHPQRGLKHSRLSLSSVACRDAAQAHCEGVSRELQEREAHLGEQLQGARSEASQAAVAQMAAAAQAREQLEGHLAFLRATSADWQVRAASSLLASYSFLLPLNFSGGPPGSPARHCG